MHRVTAKEREAVERTTKQKMARCHLNREGGNHLDEESNRQTTMEDIDGGLHPVVDGQSLDEDEDEDEDEVKSQLISDGCWKISATLNGFSSYCFGRSTCKYYV